MRGLTVSQQQILVYILEHLQNRGAPPDAHDIATAVRMKHPSEEIAHLERRGLIEKDRGAGYCLHLQEN